MSGFKSQEHHDAGDRFIAKSRVPVRRAILQDRLPWRIKTMLLFPEAGALGIMYCADRFGVSHHGQALGSRRRQLGRRLTVKLVQAMCSTREDIEAYHQTFTTQRSGSTRIAFDICMHAVRLQSREDVLCRLSNMSFWCSGRNSHTPFLPDDPPAMWKLNKRHQRLFYIESIWKKPRCSKAYSTD